MQKKKADVQNIRQSNFVLSYGPGAIIETKNGARLIPMPDKFGVLRKGGINPKFLKRFEISDTRLSAVIKALRQNMIYKNRTENLNVHIYRLPGNSDDFRRLYEGIIYGTHIFPRYFVCYNSEEHMKRMDRGDFVLFYANSREAECPVCKEKSDPKRISQVRFIMACPQGHMDEVDWNRAVHGDKSCGITQSDMWFWWKPEGSTLDSIVVECPRCKSKVTVGEIYRMNFRCTSRYPEEELPISTNYRPPYLTNPSRQGSCNAEMKVIQRQSSALHIPITLSLLTIPQLDRRIAEILQIEAIGDALIILIDDLHKPDFIDKLDRKLQMLVNNNRLSQSIKNDFISILKEKKQELIVEEGLKDLIRRLAISANSSKGSFMDYIYEEFESLIEAADKADKTGYYESDNGNFAMAPGIIVNSTDFTPSLKVYPVEKLRTVTAQIGYEREIFGSRRRGTIRKNDGSEEERYGLVNPTIKDVGYRNYENGEVWYPGYVGSGEGIFIKFTDSSDVEKYIFRKHESTVRLWLKDEYHKGYTISPWSDISYKPLFVWLHTLSHSIIKAIYMTSGYSMASIRERVYISPDEKNGGILLYTTSPSADGSLGGLISVVRLMDDILQKAIDSLLVCSNDPLCISTHKDPKSPNGAACYSCLFVSETSCEHGNRWLDRHIVVG